MAGVHDRPGLREQWPGSDAAGQAIGEHDRGEVEQGGQPHRGQLERDDPTDEAEDERPQRIDGARVRELGEAGVALDYDCETYPGMKSACDEQLGAGLIFNAGAYAANKLCDLHGGHRYIVGDEPDMAGAFECIATVGMSGSAPLLGDAMIAALSPKLNGAGANDEWYRAGCI